MNPLRILAKAAVDVRAFFASEQIRLLPFLDVLKGYGRPKLRADARAAINVTLLALPQSIAFAAIAGLDMHIADVDAARSLYVSGLGGEPQAEREAIA